jgi:hypothetical protein
MFLIGAARALLLFIGIHNAWDTVVYNVFVQRRQCGGGEERSIGRRASERRERTAEQLIGVPDAGSVSLIGI